MGQGWVPAFMAGKKCLGELGMARCLYHHVSGTGHSRTRPAYPFDNITAPVDNAGTQSRSFAQPIAVGSFTRHQRADRCALHRSVVRFDVGTALGCLLVNLQLVRALQPWSSNVGKRLVKTPKTYVRDSGLVHSLLGLASIDSLLAHPVAGASWEGFVIEQLIAAVPDATASFYRTTHGAEADLVLEFRNGDTWIVEIKRSSAPTVSKGFYSAAIDLGATRKWVVAPVAESYPMRDGIEVHNPLTAASMTLAYLCQNDCFLLRHSR